MKDYLNGPTIWVKGYIILVYCVYYSGVDRERESEIQRERETEREGRLMFEGYLTN
jgi:hypothetical protein